MIIKWYYCGDYYCTTDNLSINNAIGGMLQDPPANAAFEIFIYDEEILDECESELKPRIKKELAEQIAKTGAAILIYSKPGAPYCDKETVAKHTKGNLADDLLEALNKAGWEIETHYIPEHIGGTRVTTKSK